MKRLLVTVSVLALSLGMAHPALAADATNGRIARKAARGVENVALGFVTEWPKTVYYDSIDHGIPYGITLGALRGVGVGVFRTGIGVYELLTFPVPVPEKYEPLLHPEFPHDVVERTTQ